jgi:hypothetical protein
MHSDQARLETRRHAGAGGLDMLTNVILKAKEDRVDQGDGGLVSSEHSSGGIAKELQPARDDLHHTPVFGRQSFQGEAVERGISFAR